MSHDVAEPLSSGPPPPAPAAAVGGVWRRLVPLVLVVALVLVLGGGAALGPDLFGLRSVVVESRALEPSIPLGAVMVQRAVPPAGLRPGDIITFTTDRTPSVIYTHEVVSVQPAPSIVQLRTRPLGGGDEEQWLVVPGQAVGRLVCWIPLAGFVLGSVRLPGAGLGLLAVGAVLLWLSLRSRPLPPAAAEPEASADR